MPLQLSDKVRALGDQAQRELVDEFSRIDTIAQENTQRVLAAFQDHRVADSYFAGTTGYGYDDLGRDKLDEIYADLDAGCRRRLAGVTIADIEDRLFAGKPLFAAEQELTDGI